jgi:hypothetical protein
MKWTLLVGFVAVLVLGVPHSVSASVPNVKAPTGPSYGGFFTGSYSFETYITCQSGLTFQSSYSNSLEGTHTFDFDGADDGSLMVRIDGGGDQIIYSCGDPRPSVLSASYSVSKDTTNPSIGITSPADGSSTSSSSIDVAVSAGDSTSGIGSVSVNGQGAAFSGGLWHVTVGLNVGSNTLAATAYDRAGNSAARQITVNRSASSPSPQPPPPSGGGTSSTPRPSPPTYTANQTPVPAPAPPVSSETPPVQAPAPVIAPIVIPSSTPNIVQTPAPKPLKKVPTNDINWLSWLMKLLASLPLLAIIGIIVGVRSVRHAIVLYFQLLRIRLHPYIFKLKMTLKGYAHDMPRTGLVSHRRHTGKVLAHHHTSYPALVFLVLCTMVLSAAVSFSGHAESSTLSMTVLGPPPASGAYINAPVDGDIVTAATIAVKGTCPSGLVIELYRDGGFAGSGYCDVNGQFAISISLNPGLNNIVARDVDALGQYGPDSNTVGVTYNPPPSPSPTPTPSPSPSPSPTPSPAPSPSATPTPTAAPKPSPTPTKSTPKTSKTPTAIPGALPALTIDSDQHYFKGINPGESVTWHIKIISGTPPFKINWNWGDGSHDSAISTDRSVTSLAHTYRDPGYYRVTATVTDAAGHTAILQVLVIVNGFATQPGNTSKPDFGFLIPVWPLLFGMLLLTVSFWLGERTFKGQHPALQPQT